MNGALALLIALVSYGNVYLKTGNLSHPLDFNNTTLIYNANITFSDTIKLGSKSTVATDPQQWFNFLKKSGCMKFRLVYDHSKELQMKDYESAGFVGGGGVWQIEAVYIDHSDYWESAEVVVNENAADKRIWSTKLKIAAKNQGGSSLLIPKQTAKEQLAVALKNIIRFASEHKSDEWVKVFKTSNKQLTDTHPTIAYYKDIVVKKQYSLESIQLLSAATTAYVFGGMGSWNDILYPTDKENKTNAELTADLYDKVNNAIIAAINE